MKIKQAVKLLAALAQESRLNVFRFLVEAGAEGLSAGEISERLDIPPATMSFHLKELTSNGLIAPTRDGRSINYSLQPDVINELLQFLLQDCCQGRPELCQPNFIRNGTFCDKPKPRAKAKSARS